MSNNNFYIDGNWEFYILGYSLYTFFLDQQDLDWNQEEDLSAQFNTLSMENNLGRRIDLVSEQIRGIEDIPARITSLEKNFIG